VRSFKKGRKQTKSEETQMKVQEIEVEKKQMNRFRIVSSAVERRIQAGQGRRRRRS
jgi:hypothetical protein